jgi:hypothetical protein
VFTSAYRIYEIYWVPPGYGVASGYQSTIDGFAQNIAADSGKTSNVFYSDTPVRRRCRQYAFSYGGSATASDPFPASGCADSALPSGPCLNDNQVASEIGAVAAAHGWSIGYPNIFVVMMPKYAGNCASYSSGCLEGYCTFTNACAWHHQWGGLYFVVQPYVGAVGGCSSGQSPSGAYDADQAINTISHEVNESVTDPAGGSWSDVNGNENGDKCAWNFATALGGTTGKLYNQLINGTRLLPPAGVEQPDFEVRAQRDVGLAAGISVARRGLTRHRPPRGNCLADGPRCGARRCCRTRHGRGIASPMRDLAGAGPRQRHSVA